MPFGVVFLFIIKIIDRCLQLQVPIREITHNEKYIIVDKLGILFNLNIRCNSDFVNKLAVRCAINVGCELYVSLTVSLIKTA